MLFVLARGLSGECHLFVQSILVQKNLWSAELRVMLLLFLDLVTHQSASISEAFSVQ